MKSFAVLFEKLDQTTETSVKVAALAEYFSEASDEDKVWAIALLSHRRPKRTVASTLLRAWAEEASNLPAWLFEESYRMVGDLAETISLVLPVPLVLNNKSLSDWLSIIIDAQHLDEEELSIIVKDSWANLAVGPRLIFNKLITGGFRFGVSQRILTQSLAVATDKEESQLSHRLMGKWDPQNVSFESLILSKDIKDSLSKPYPINFASALDKEPMELGDSKDWQVERKWDGIRGQIIKREEELFVWSGGKELVTDKFPEYQALQIGLPNGTVLDGEILPLRDGRPLSCSYLQSRIGKKNITKKIMQETPVVLMAFDLLEWEGEDIRARPLQERRVLLEKLVSANDCDGILMISDLVKLDTWIGIAAERENSRAYGTEGLMLKKKDSVYLMGRDTGTWWTWQIDPMTIDAVLLYAQADPASRSSIFTNYTFAVWKGDQLVPITKASSGLIEKDYKEITAFVKKNTIERFGPVRSVKPELVFELAFEGINESTRHKSGVALRFPRMLRWRKDQPASEANSLEDLQKLLSLYG